jgi:hypothetical protein
MGYTLKDLLEFKEAVEQEGGITNGIHKESNRT